MSVAAGIDLQYDERGCLRDDLSCVKCQYNLRTLHRDAACPECGTAVGRSIEGNKLRFCDPSWLKEVWEGLNCFGIAVVSGIGFVVFMLSYDSPRDRFLIVGVALYATSLALCVYGFFKATRRDPARIDREGLLNARRLGRLSWCGAFVLFILTMLQAGLTDAEPVTAEIVLLLVLLFAGPVFLLTHAAGLAARLPNRLLVLGVWLVNTCVVLVGLFIVVVSITELWNWLEQYTRRDLWELRYALRKLTPGLLIGLLCLLVALLIWYWWALSRAAKFAWATWATRDG